MGPVIRTRANTGRYSRGTIFRILAKFLREFISVQIHVAPVFVPARIQEKFLANYLCIGFVPRGTIFELFRGLQLGLCGVFGIN